ncbi:MAG: deoxyribodipyrimidine photo-lyase [Bauldia litoralis]
MKSDTADAPRLFWFRDDLRLDDNPGLSAACRGGSPLILLFVLDDSDDGTRRLGGAARWWLHGSLESLSQDLAALGQTLTLRRGPARDVVRDLVEETGVRRAFWNRRYGFAGDLDSDVAADLEKAGCATEAFSANLLFEPGAVRSGKGDPFRVYSAYWRAAQQTDEIRDPVSAPKTLPPPLPDLSGESLDALALLPTHPDWAGGMRDAWQPGEAGASERLRAFLDDRVAAYAKRRDFPADPATSKLSPHLRFGEISPVQIWHATAKVREAQKFRAEVGWREFAWHALAQAPDMTRANLRDEFDGFPWADPDEEILRAWQMGRTGYPIVDAGMRQLWQTGWMHNRVRMVVASFLTKHLLIDWRHGEQWFWDTLVDADPANNPFGWQWVAGSGFDAQPYFRIFNPVLQGQKFDPDGAYVRTFVPEIAELADRDIHTPWEASPMELKAAGIELGVDYPTPIVDHREARARALEAYQEMRQAD